MLPEFSKSLPGGQVDEYRLFLFNFQHLAHIPPVQFPLTRVQFFPAPLSLNWWEYRCYYSLQRVLFAQPLLYLFLQPLKCVCRTSGMQYVTKIPYCLMPYFSPVSFRPLIHAGEVLRRVSLDSEKSLSEFSYIFRWELYYKINVINKLEYICTPIYI